MVRKKSMTARKKTDYFFLKKKTFEFPEKFETCLLGKFLQLGHWGVMSFGKSNFSVILLC